ncbi:MAG TPA: alpha/beta hydrolase [Mycobacteriales bacterium]
MIERAVDLAEATFAYLEDGPADGPPVVVVHGFPDSPYSWKGVIAALAADGHRVLAPFLRGYAPTAVPADGRYQTGQLAADVRDLVLATTDGPVDLVGHDWGAPAVYGAANLLGDRCRRVVGLAVPPALGGESLFSYAQAKRSFYMFFFQLPVDPVVAAGDFAFLDGLWDDWTMPATDSAAARAAVKECLREPANLAAALGYYRALFNPDPALSAEQEATATRPTQPLLYLHGAADGCMGVELTEGVEGRVVVEGANHFLQLDRPGEVERRITEFLAT